MLYLWAFVSWCLCGEVGRIYDMLVVNGPTWQTKESSNCCIKMSQMLSVAYDLVAHHVFDRPLFWIFLGQFGFDHILLPVILCFRARKPVWCFFSSFGVFAEPCDRCYNPSLCSSRSQFKGPMITQAIHVQMAKWTELRLRLERIAAEQEVGPAWLPHTLGVGLDMFKLMSTTRP